MQDSSTLTTLRDFDGAKPLPPTPLATRRLRPPRQIAVEQNGAAKETLQNIIPSDYSELDLIFELSERILWCYMQPEGPPSFTPGMMREVNKLHRLIHATRDEQANANAKYYVVGSRRDGIFNLGGDLAHLMTCIKARNKAELTRYAYSCIEGIHSISIGFASPVISIGMVQGTALGGGFECAMSFHVLVAERSVKMGFPEVLFGLFPGMGAYSFLSRKIGIAAAHKMISEGKIYSAGDLFDMGIVDILCADGDGEASVRSYISQNGRRHGQLMALNKARQIVDPITYEELRDVTDIWVETAMDLDASDLRRMERLVNAQRR